MRTHTRASHMHIHACMLNMINTASYAGRYNTTLGVGTRSQVNTGSATAKYEKRAQSTFIKCGLKLTQHRSTLCEVTLHETPDDKSPREIFWLLIFYNIAFFFTLSDSLLNLSHLVLDSTSLFNTIIQSRQVPSCMFISRYWTKVFINKSINKRY